MMKNHIMRKLFIGNIIIFIFLLLLQLIFQTLLFEPFLADEQTKRLMRSMQAVQSAILIDDEEAVREKTNDGLNRGMVMVALDQNMHQIYGQDFDQYQRCFSIEDEHGKLYNIVEDYMESVPLQTIEVGDKLSIEGYLVDERNALVIPSKVYRPSDGVVLGTDTFLLVDQTNETQSVEQPDSIDMGSSLTAPLMAGITIVNDTPISNKGEGVVIGDNSKVDRGIVIGDDGDPTIQPAAVSKTSAMSANDIQPTGSEPSTSQPAVDQQDAVSLQKGFLLESPFDSSSDNDDLELSGSLSDGQQSSTLRAERMLIINGEGRDGNSYPISINGRVVLKVDVSNTDLTVQQGLIKDEIKRLSTNKNPVTSTGTFTVNSQLTTGKYVLCVSRIAESQTTLIGAISLYSIKDINVMINVFHVLLFITELGLLLFALYFFSRMISKPLVEMNAVALKIAKQDFSSKVNVTSQDEVGTLGVSINEISTNLEQKIKQINTINDQLQMDYERQIELQQLHKKLSASFSHELKTPLTIVRGCIDSIQSGIYLPNQVEYYHIALRELDNASNLITQMLEIARMESPYFALKKNVFDLWMVFFKVYDELKQTMDEQRMQVQFSVEDEANTIADAELMESVITNALTNAMKYSPKGSQISVRITTTQERHTFSIVNENSFIPPEELEKIWSPFYRVNKSKESAASGTGLGLMIVSEILNAHGFAYGIRNTDQGVEFSFSCPAVILSAE